MSLLPSATEIVGALGAGMMAGAVPRRCNLTLQNERQYGPRVRAVSTVGADPDAVRYAQARAVVVRLASTRERVEHLSGEMELRSSPGPGCRLLVSCPIEVAHARSIG